MAETLKFLIEVATEQGEAAIERITEKLDHIAEHSKSAADETSMNMAKAGAAMVAAGLAIGTALILMTEHTEKLGAELHRMSLQSGTSTEELQILGFAAERTGGSLEDIGTGLKFLSKNLIAAAEGGKKQEDAFVSLGLSVRTAGGEMKTAGVLILEVADKFAEMRDGAEKTALAIKLFGRSGIEMIPVLNLGRAGIEESGEALKKLNGLMGEDAIVASHKLHEAQVDLEHAFEGVSLTIGSVLLPAMTDMILAITPLIAQFSHWVQAHPELIRLAGALAASLIGTGGVLVAVSAVTLALPALTTGLGLLGGAATLATGGLYALAIALAYTFREELGAMLSSIKAFVHDGLAYLVGKIGDMMGALAPVSDSFGRLRDSLKTTQFALEESAKADRDVAEQLDASEPIIIRNTEKVDAWIQTHMKAPPVINATKSAVDELVKSMTKNVQLQTDLSAAIAVGEARHISATRIATAFASQLDEVGKSALAAGDLIDASLTPYLKLRADQLALETSQKAMEESAKKSFEAQQKLGDALEEVGIHTTDVMASTEHYVSEMNFHFKTAVDAGTATVIDHKTALDHLMDSMQDAAVRQRELATAVSAANFEEEQAIALLIRRNLILLAPPSYLPGGALEPPVIGPPSTKIDNSNNWKLWQKDGQEAIDHVTDGISKMFLDSISHGKSLWEGFKALGKDAIASIADTFLHTMLHAFLDHFADSFGKFLDTQIKDKLTGLVSGLFKKATDTVTGAATDIATKTAAETAASTAASTASTAASTGLTAATSSLMSTINMVSGIASAVGSIVGAVGTMRLEGTMNAVEHNTRYLMIDFENTMNEILWPMHSFMLWTAQNTHELINQLDAVYNLLAGYLQMLVDEVGSLYNVTNLNLSLIAVATSQMATRASSAVIASLSTSEPSGTTLGPGTETVVPATAAASNSSQIFAAAVDRFVAAQAVQPPTTVSIPIQIDNQFNFYGQEINRALVRDFIVPEITQVLESGVNTVREKWTQLFDNTRDGVVSTAVTTG